MTYRLGVLASHPIQYQAPFFRELAKLVDLKVFFAHRLSSEGQAAAGFGVPFDWDVDLLRGYESTFLPNHSRDPGVSSFFGCDTPQISDEIRLGNFDAFLVLGWYLKSYWQGIRACRRHRVPVMVRGDSQLGTPRGWPKQVGKEIVYPRVLGQFDACLYVGERNRLYLEHYGVSTERLFFSPHCVDNAWFGDLATASARDDLRGRFGIGPTEKLVLFAAKLLPFKRPLDVVEACAAMRRRGLAVGVIVAGSGELESAVRERTAALGIPLYLLGFCNQTQMPAAYAAADVLALPSSSETWGLVANEALACGRPIVVSDACGCAPDLAGDGTVGRCFPVGDVQALADALAGVLNECPTREQFARKVSVYSPARAAGGVCEALTCLLSR